MSKINNLSIDNQYASAQDIIKYLNGNGASIIIPELNLNLAMLLWKIPGNLQQWDKNKQHKIVTKEPRIPGSTKAITPKRFPGTQPQGRGRGKGRGAESIPVSFKTSPPIPGTPILSPTPSPYKTRVDLPSLF